MLRNEEQIEKERAEGEEEKKSHGVVAAAAAIKRFPDTHSINQYQSNEQRNGNEQLEGYATIDNGKKKNINEGFEATQFFYLFISSDRLHIISSPYPPYGMFCFSCVWHCA